MSMFLTISAAGQTKRWRWESEQCPDIQKFITLNYGTSGFHSSVDYVERSYEVSPVDEANGDNATDGDVDEHRHIGNPTGHVHRVNYGGDLAEVVVKYNRVNTSLLPTHEYVRAFVHDQSVVEDEVSVSDNTFKFSTSLTKNDMAKLCTDVFDCMDQDQDEGEESHITHVSYGGAPLWARSS